MMKKRFFSALLCLCLLIGLVPGAVTTAFAAGDYKIGDTVNFAGYEWYIIGTDEETDGGVTAPAGCYTLLAKNNEFGSTTFRASGDTRYIAIVYYKDSDLQEKMTEIANGFSQEDRNNIQTRTLKYGYDGILGYDVENQYLWPLSYDESKTVDSLRIWGDVFIGAWSRTGIFKDKPDYGVWLYSSYQSAAVWDSYEKPDQTYNVRPALYVKQEAVKPPTVQPHVDFYLSADTISNASVGENLVANSGDDTPLTRSENQNADVRAYSDGGTTQYGTSLLFHFSSATIGANQVVACVLTDEDGNVKYYGKLADRSDSAPDVDDVSVPLAGVAEGTYTLSIFSHNTQTGEISEPSPTMTVTVVGSIGFVSNYDGDTYTKIEIVIPPNPGPAFTQHPQDQIIEENGSATFTAEADGSGFTYYWQAQPKSSDPDTGTWYNILIYVEGGVSVTRHSGQSLSLSNVSGTWEDNGYTLDGLNSFDPADARFRCWAYTGGGTLNSYSNPAELTVIPSGGGEDGREVELRTTDTHIQWRYEGEDDSAWRDLVALDAITGGDGADGADGREVELQIANGYIQWRYTTGADTDWKNLMPLSDLKGEDGEDGDTPYIGSNGNWWIGTMDTGVRANGKNGSSGSDGSDGRDGRDGKDGEDGLTPFIGSNGNWWIGAADTGVPAAGADGAPGRDGVGISGLFINEAGELVITLTDGTENNLGRVTGEDGAGIAGITIGEAGEMSAALTDGTELNAGVVPTNGPEMSCLRLLVYLALGMSALSLTGLLVAGGLWYRRRRASRS